jgi:hypothetical protein
MTIYLQGAESFLLGMPAVDESLKTFPAFFEGRRWFNMNFPSCYEARRLITTNFPSFYEVRRLITMNFP